ncbi:MAG TPA: carboxypeptidase, partial [Rubrivivax sp.]
DIGTKLTGYPAISTFHDFKYHPKEIITGTQDWVYEHVGALFWTVELWAPNKEAGITDYDWIHWYRDHPPEDDLKLLKWSDEQCGGRAHVDWYPYHHPQLGEVEIGGWDRMNYWRNPPPHLREREAARFPAWLMQLGLSLPKLEILRAEVRALGPDTWRVRFAVANSGYLPSYVSKRALERKTARGTVFQIHLPPEARLDNGRERIEGAHLEGHAPKTSLQAFLPNRDLTGDRAVAEWVVHAPAGTRLALTATADRAGTVRTEITLD